MSMNHYGVSDYGLLLTADMLKTIALQKYTCTEAEYDEDPWAYIDSLRNELCEYISEFTGQSVPITNDGHDDWFLPQEDYDGDTIYYVSAQSESTLFRAAYRDIDELIEEVKAVVGKYFPEDFNYRAQLRHITGTYYG